jgi:hemin uptake protein HemP
LVLYAQRPTPTTTKEATIVTDVPTSSTDVRQPKAEKTVLVRAGELFQGKREVRIEHQGIVYRLRITRRNKLILQK